MISFSRSGRTVLAVSRSSVTIGTVFDSFYERDSETRGPFLESRRCQNGFEVWVGRRHLIVECPTLARLLERLFTPPTAAA